MPKYNVTGWIQLVICFNEIIEADNENQATEEVYQRYPHNEVQDYDLDAKLIEENK